MSKPKESEVSDDVYSEQFTTTDPREMRKKMMGMACGFPFDEDAPSRSMVIGSIIRNVRDMAAVAGLSGEDLHTVLAWHLMHHAARMERMALENEMLRPARQIIDGHAAARANAGL